MTADAARLKTALDAGGLTPQRLADLQRKLEDSISFRAQRATRAPKPSLSADLPVIARRAEIAEAIKAHQVVILCGETGSGKTTQLPQICLSLGRGVAGMIGHTQPRRIAARSVAARIAEELDVPLGGPVGFKVRFGDQTSNHTLIKLMTDGILLAETQTDPDLLDYDTIILDEAHERSLNIDFLMGYLRRLLPRRPDLKLIVTSATIDPAKFSDHFGGPSVAPVIEVSGRTYPVELRYRPVGDDAEDFEEVEEHAVVDAVEELCSPRLPKGDVLVFVPGEREIRSCARALMSGSRIDADVLPLYARLSPAEQDRIFRPAQRRRIIIATNVAETSVTVPGIRYVVDTGLSRQSKYDPRTRVQRLPVATISQASARQRSGRCGRVAAGVCIRLYAESQFNAWPAFTTPEILRSSLASVILRMKSLALGPVEEFPFLDVPSAAMIRDGYQTLFELGALTAPDATGELTPIGRRLAVLPLEPNIGRMVIAAEEEDCVEEVLTLAAALSIQDPRDRPMSRQRDADTAHLVFWNETSDFLVLLNIWDQFQDASSKLSHGPLLSWCRERFVNFNRLREWSETRRQLRSMVMGDDEEEVPEEAAPHVHAKVAPRPLHDRIHRALMTGLLSNLCCRDEGGPFEYQGSRGNRVTIFPGSVLFRKGPKWLMAAELVLTTKLFARTCAKVDPAWIEELAEHVMTRTGGDSHWDKDKGEAAVWERLTLAGAVVVPRRRAPLARIDPAAARTLFIRHALVRGELDTDAPFAVANRAVMARAASLEAKCRRRGMIRDESSLIAWFDSRLPKTILDRTTLEQFLSTNPVATRALSIPLADVLTPQAIAAAGPDQFPDDITLDGAVARLEYHLDPGKDEDGITARINLLHLPKLDDDRADWLVPGLLPDKITAIFKALPKQYRAPLESNAKESLSSLAEQCASVMTFAKGPLAPALSEAIEVLRGVKVPPEAMLVSVPDYLRMRVLVEDDHGKELAAGRDLAELRERLAGRLRRAQAGAARARFEQRGITAWTFGELPDDVPTVLDDQSVTAFPALIDDTNSVSLTLLDDASRAAEHTRLGIRRLFAIAAREELAHRIEVLPGWDEMKRQHKALGTDDELRDALSLLIAERVFLVGQPPVRNAQTFESRQLEQWGRLGQSTLEVGAAVAAMLESRFRVAGRLAGGTPRQWATSIADIREHAAYLMPRGFLRLTSWERLREYPRYAAALRARLFKLREDGRDVESASLASVLPHWKRFTGWVAAAMSRERLLAEQAGDAAAKTGKSKQPLPGAKRAAPTVNVDAGEWALRPGALPKPVAAYRWAVEEFRVCAFAPEIGGPAATAKQLDDLWSKTPRES